MLPALFGYGIVNNVWRYQIYIVSVRWRNVPTGGISRQGEHFGHQVRQNWQSQTLSTEAAFLPPRPRTESLHYGDKWKKLMVLDWYEPSGLSVIDYFNEWNFLKVIRNKRIIFKKQETYMNLHSLCSLFFKTFQFTCSSVSNNSVMNTVASSRPNLHTGLAADTSNSMYIFSDSNELVMLCSFSQPQLRIPTLWHVIPCNVITVLPWR